MGTALNGHCRSQARSSRLPLRSGRLLLKAWKDLFHSEKDRQLRRRHRLYDVDAFKSLSESRVTPLALGFVSQKKRETGRVRGGGARGLGTKQRRWGSLQPQNPASPLQLLGYLSPRALFPFSQAQGSLRTFCTKINFKDLTSRGQHGPGLWATENNHTEDTMVVPQPRLLSRILRIILTKWDLES